MFLESWPSIITCSCDKAIKIFEYPSFKEVRVIKTNHAGSIRKLIAIDGERITSASKDKTIKLLDVKTGNLIFTFEGPKCK